MADNIILKFTNYSVEKINYYKNNNYNEENESIGFPKIGFKISKSKNNPNKFNIILGATYDQENNFPYILEIIIRGFFETDESLATDKDKLEVVLSNGSAIMYPYIRALFTEITSKSDYSAIVLPTVNFYEYIKKLYKDNKHSLICNDDYIEE